MSFCSFCSAIQNCHEISLATVDGNSSEKYILFISIHDAELVLTVSDGIFVWRTQMTSEEINAHREANSLSWETYTSMLSISLQQKSLSAKIIDKEKLRIIFGPQTDSIFYSLYKLCEEDQKHSVRDILYKTANQYDLLKDELQSTQDELCKLKSKSPSKASKEGFLNVDGKQKPQATGKVLPTQGMSIVNPTSRKRKAPKGVAFD